MRYQPLMRTATDWVSCVLCALVTLDSGLESRLLRKESRLRDRSRRCKRSVRDWTQRCKRSLHVRTLTLPVFDKNAITNPPEYAELHTTVTITTPGHCSPVTRKLPPMLTPRRAPLGEGRCPVCCHADVPWFRTSVEERRLLEPKIPLLSKNPPVTIYTCTTQHNNEDTDMASDICR